MNYVYIKRYNPAYDIFLIKYFKEAGFVFDDKISFEELLPGWVLGSEGRELTSDEKLFCYYMNDWREHPEVRPAYYELFEKVIGSNGAIDVKNLRDLESQLPDHKGRLVFSSEEAAKVIAEFYRDFMKNPLRKRMEEGAVGRDLMEFFSRKEFGALPDSRHADVEVSDQARNRIAGQLLDWLGTITAEEVDSDIRRVLREHEKMGEHMKLFPPDPHTKIASWSCIHQSELVEINCYKQVGQNHTTIFLQPTRGFDISDSVLEPGWNYLVFPQYQVVNIDDDQKR